ncbi:autotransporter domain-containing protein [Phascolarctobacterium succinatutens]|uniref:autotransporter domain-containing protein n=1 Tax=Phascolarctobacterium succinatutens TaxID=626940 RepID=UPI003AF1882C
MLKLSRKKKNTWLALAVAASIMGGGTVFAAETANYTDTLNGMWDPAYEAAKVADGEFKFTQDTQITNQYGIVAETDLKIDAEGKTLTLVAKDIKGLPGSGIKIDDANTLSIKAATIKMNLTGTKIPDAGLQGVRLNNTDAKLTVDGNMDIKANGTNNTMGIYTKGNIVVNGNVKTNIDGNGGGNKYYGAAGIYVSSNYNDTKGGSVTINGNVDLLGNANGLFVNMGGSKINVDGGKIEVFDILENGYAAIRAENGIVNMNVVQDKDGNVTGAANNKVIINGNLGVSTGAVFASDKHGTKSEINLGLTTKDSVLTGVVENTFNDEGNKAGSYTFTGAVNLWLQNGATWNNEKVGTALGDLEDSLEEFSGSHVAKLVGGNDANNVGTIVQKDANNLTIDNYSGHTNIFYAHTGNGESKGHYSKYGDTIIKHAEAGSVVNLITGNNDVKMTDENSVNKVLNALASKLTYSNFTNNEKNLKGYVKIADGLTASSAAKIYGDITFNADGKGTCSGAVKPEPVEPPKTEFTTVLTGDAAADKEYAGNIKDGKYIFDGDSTIKVTGATAVDVKAPLTIDAGNYQLTISSKGYTSFISTVFNQNIDGKTSIKAGELIIGNPKGFDDRSGIVVNKGAMDINADVTVYAYNDTPNSAYGILAQNNGSKVDIHGNLKLSNGGSTVTHGLVAESMQDSGKGSTITVDGNADINIKNGNAISAIRNGSAVSVGGGTIQIAENKEYYALKADGGVINVNMNAAKDGAGAANTVIKGNISAYGGQAFENFDFDAMDSTINLGLSDKKSSLTGVVFSKDNGEKNAPFKGIVNLYVSNGAVWNNQAWGKTADAFEGSHITKLAGGASKDTAGIIRQNDVNNITIDNYSGNMKLIYQGNKGTNTFAGGDTVIKSAAEGSYILVIGENTGIDVTNADSVSDSLNALAGKLYYTGYVGQKENNLTGQVQLASGLTGSSQSTDLKNITFSEEDGKGSTGSGTIVTPGEQTKDTFTTEITGLKQSAYMNGGVQKEDKSYVFTKDTTIKVNQMTFKEKVADSQYADDYIISGAAVQNGKGVKDLVIKAEDKTLKLNVALDDNTTPPNPAPGILTNRLPLRGIDNSVAGSTTNVTAGTLDINVDNTYSRKSGQNKVIDPSSAIGIYANSTGEKAVVTVNGNTVIKAHGHNNVYGVNANGNSEIKLNGDLTMAKNGDKWAIENVINGTNTTTLADDATWRSIAGINAYGAGASVTVDGKTTISAHGSGVVAADGGTVTLGAADIEIMNNSDEKGYAYHALGAALGTVNVGGEGKTVTVKGNAGLFGKQNQKFASDSKESVINLKLTTADSSWTGVAYKHFDAEKDAGLSGSMNLTLANGASWTNEKYGYVYGDLEWGKYKFTGSEIANFVGGASDAKAGNIFQKDANSLTIDNYSGNTNIFYTHTGNGEAASDYAAGDTVIKHAAEGSVVSLLTDSKGVNMKSDDSVANVLNALAGKLTYSNFANEKNLTGYVKIADGLTASSKELKKGDIAFNAEDGKGSLKKEDVKPEPPTPPTVPSEFKQGITGDAAKDTAYADVIKDGKYVFEKDTEITSSTAVNAQSKDITIDNSNSKLVLNGSMFGINAEGKTVTVNGVTEINSDNIAINVAFDGNVILDNGATINGNIEGFMGGNISINKNEKPAATVINGDIKLDGCSADIALVDSDSKLTGSYELEDSTLKLTIKDKAVWDFKGGKGNGLTLVGGKTEAASGFIIMNDAPGGATTYSLRAVPPSASGMTIDKYSGWETFIYAHNNDGDEVSDYTSGDVIIKKADASSGVILSTDNSGINMKDKDAVEATLKALAQKITYKDHEANSGNLTGKVQIAGGLTASSNALNIGDMLWDGNGKGQYKDGSVSWNPGTEGPGTEGPGTGAPGTGDPGTGGPGTGGDNSNKIIEGDYETFVMKGVRSAATTSLHTWRDNMQDTYTGADMADEDGMFAKALGGKTSSDVKGLKDSNTYYGVQVGYDKAAANGWHTGVAFDYRNGDSNYLLGGKGDNQMYSLGVYGVKNFENDAFFRVAAKVGRVQNEYDVYNEIRSLKLNGDYKANAYGLTMEYGKTFGDEEAYFTPKAQLTWSQVGAKDYTARTDNATMQISQDSYSSFVGRLGFEAGVKSEKGRVYAGLFAAHEFNGDISASYFANDGDRKHTSFNGEETWMEMKLGGSYDFSKTAHLYADIAKDFGGNFERKWKLNAGLRFEF